MTVKQEAKKVLYSDEGFDKMYANFVEIQSVYTKCSSFFPFTSQLYNQLKAGCIEVV